MDYQKYPQSHVNDEIQLNFVTIVNLVKKVINYSKGLDENIDAKKMKGKWKGYYRIKIGKVRMILRIDFKNKIAFIDRIDFRGDIYK